MSFIKNHDLVSLGKLRPLMMLYWLIVNGELANVWQSLDLAGAAASLTDCVLVDSAMNGFAKIRSRFIVRFPAGIFTTTAACNSRCSVTVRAFSSTVGRFRSSVNYRTHFCVVLRGPWKHSTRSNFVRVADFSSR